jgi:ABC-type branched-subunit amino acid transport system ATPase component
MAVLDVRGLVKRFGSLEVTRNVSFVLNEGARSALIGPNGAGKTTLINLICGRLLPSAGEIWIDGRNVTRASEAGRVKAGVGRTFQINSLFRRLTVEENISLAVAEHLGLAWRMRPGRRVRARIEGRVAEVLSMLRISDSARTPIEVLPYGLQRMVELGIALALEPRILLLDEPAAGVPRAEAGVILETIGNLPKTMAVLLIEHDIDLVFRFASRVTVLVSGSILVEGTPKEISEHEGVRALYLGERGRHA